MSHTCPPEHEGWLVEALASGPEALDPARRRALEACAHCSVEWAELLEVRTTLARAADAERQNVASAVRAAGATEEHFVREVLARRLAPAAPRGRRIVPWLLVGAAVAAGLALWLVPRGEGGAPRTRRPEVMLGERRIALETDENQHGFATFAWTDTKPDAGGYRVRVWPADDPGSDPIFERIVDVPQLLLEPEATSSWPEHVLLRVEALDRDRSPVKGAVDSAPFSR